MFNLTKEQMEKLNKWLESNPPVARGAIGGSITYSFTPTSLGVVVKVKNDLSGAEIDLTEYENW